MRFSGIVAASMVAPLVVAHGDHVPGAPKIWGLGPNPMEKLKSRSSVAARRALPQQGPKLNARQGGNNGRCGPEGGGASCDEGYCCSSAGWCGKGTEYCAAPDCLFQYGSGCDANQTPAGSSTRNVARPQLGNVAYGGEGIYACRVPGTVAITYDDGPYVYTEGVLDQFKSYGAKGTFFITGNNIGKGAIDTNWASVIQRMVNEGHQVASHTWSHQDLSAITQEQRYDQMVKNEMAIRNIIGKFPTYMRPPYSSCTAASGCQKDLADLGYVVSYFDLDTDDYNNVTPDKIQNAKDRVFNALNPSNSANDDFLAIAHDIHQQTAQNLTGYMLDLLTQKGYRAVTMGECMGEPEANWYRDSAGGGTTPPTTTRTSGPTSTPTGVTSQDGTCGGDNGYSCIGFSEGSCCSQYGWCGSTTDHCGTGCNPLFGTCGSSGSTPSSTPAPPTPSSKTSPDGTCGGTNGYSCIGFELGSCCSQYNWCGSSTDHCGTGCNPTFGTCGSSVSPSPISPSIISSSVVSNQFSSPSGLSTSSSTAGGSSATRLSSSSAVRSPSTITTSVRPTATSSTTPTPTSNVSKNGKCGVYNQKQTCKGYGNKQCCRWDGTCGSNVFACGMGCQKKYGTCWW